MNKYLYQVQPNKSFNYMMLNNPSVESYLVDKETFNFPVNLEESYVQVKYPQRRKFINELQPAKYVEQEYNNIYVPFKNPKIDFSTFIHITHSISLDGQFYIEHDKDEEIEFIIKTCGAVTIFVNEENQAYFAPMTRNLISNKKISLKLKKGINKINIFSKELVERDVLFNFELESLYHKPITAFIELNQEVEYFKKVTEILESIYLNKDEFYADDQMVLHYDESLLDEDITFTFRPKSTIINKLPDNPAYDFFVTLKQGQSSISVDRYVDIPVGTHYCDLVFKSNDGDISRTLQFSKYMRNDLSEPSFEKRKEMAKKFILKKSENNITKALLMAATEKNDSDFAICMQNCYNKISKHEDCSDFQLSPLLWLMQKYPEKLSEKQYQDSKQIILDFRYWLDEPGNDAMWYFSENHAFLFHIAQYLSGHMFSDELFNVSQRKGKKQYELGKERVIEWFATFEKYGFAEWNSTTYLPVDFIGFVTLYECAPDKEIRCLAKKALDKTFAVIQTNLHHNIMGSSYGRVYEKELKGLHNGEMAMLTWLFFNQGHSNLSNRAVALFLLSDYKVEMDEKFKTTKKGKEFYEEQGFNKVATYIYKNQKYSVAAAINYKYKLSGHQQHMYNISFSEDEIQLWLNNPGELIFSGESRPSYWAGNGINPQIFVDKNKTIYNYDVSKSIVKFIHMYFPTFNFEEYEVNKNKVYVNHKGTYLGIVSTSEIELTMDGAVAYRELKFKDEIGSVYLELDDNLTNKSFEEFKEGFNKVTIEQYNDTTEVYSINDEYLVTNNQFYKNNILREYSEGSC